MRKIPLNQENLALYVAHTVATMPDSLRLRKIVLGALLELLPDDFADREEIAKLLETINKHEQVRAQLAKRLETIQLTLFK